MKLEDLSKQIEQTPDFPPVHLWNPALCEGVKFNIDRNKINILLGIGGSGPTKRVPSRIFINFMEKFQKLKNVSFILPPVKIVTSKLFLMKYFSLNLKTHVYL